MADLEHYLKALEAVLAEARQPGLTMAQRGGLYAAAQALAANVREDSDGYNINESYLNEKLEKFLYFLGALVGLNGGYGNAPSVCEDSARQQISGIRMQVPH